MLYTQAQIDTLKRLENMRLYCETNYYVGRGVTEVSLLSWDKVYLPKCELFDLANVAPETIELEVGIKGLTNGQAFKRIACFVLADLLKIHALTVGKKFKTDTKLLIDKGQVYESKSTDQVIKVPSSWVVLGENETWRKGFDRLNDSCKEWVRLNLNQSFFEDLA